MSTHASKKSLWKTLSPLQWAGLAAYLLLISAVYATCPISPVDGRSGLYKLVVSWQIPTQGYEHGWLVPPIAAYLLIHSWKKLRSESLRGSMHGLWFVILGCLLFILSVHTHQWRITIGIVPFLLLGAIHYYWGKDAALRSAFPLFFLWLCIPVPVFQHMTTGMQIMATSAAHWCTNLLGVHTVQEGTSLTIPSNEWSTFSVAGGCSGMRSLVALVMISFAWGYLADQLSLWKRLVLALSAIPLAIISNAFRVTSIFVCAEYINPDFASKTWHDWSGLLFFFPASLLGLMILHSLLVGEIPLLRKHRVTVSRINSKNEQEAA